MKPKLVLILLPLLPILMAVGCNPEPNPVTPEKMEQIRQKEAQERANFNPDMSAPKGQ